MAKSKPAPAARAARKAVKCGSCSAHIDVATGETFFRGRGVPANEGEPQIKALRESVKKLEDENKSLKEKISSLERPDDPPKEKSRGFLDF